MALFVCIVAGIFWLGGTTARAFIGNDMLKPGTVEFEDYLAPESEREVFRLLAVTSAVVGISYIVALVSSIVFLATSPFRMKEHGWLLMAAVLFYLFVPVEIYTMILDGKMIYKEFFTTADNEVFRELFIARVKALSGAPVVAVLCYYTAIGLAVFQPFRKSLPQDHEAGRAD
ncbi:MAG TPA: hypothetical protein VMG09_09780 [Bacteroidota bacterium]|nr:hypothetical protein [Bacteroidota bacterium]